MSNELTVAIEAAKKGAINALEYFKNQPPVTIKSDNSPVTVADKTTEEIIKNLILQSFPKAKFLGEESGGEEQFDSAWLIDPIDGTRNFIRSLPFWGIQIAYVREEKCMLGVSFGPAHNELLYAEKGFGAYCNDKKISVSKIAKVSDSFINHGNISYFDEYTNNFLTLSSKVYSERGFGDYYGYQLVAQGKAEIMLDARNKPWDIAAVKVIIEEAGGKVTDFQGNDWVLTADRTVATNGLVHDEIIAILNQKEGTL